jgi:leucyl-tRNA synthetase
MAVQINGQVKYRINVPSDADNQQIEEAALTDERAAGYIGGRNIVKVIVVKGRLVNIVVK